MEARPHPDNEPGKSYQIDDRRREAALAACNGLPTEWLERGLISELYKFVAVIALVDTMTKDDGGSLRIPRSWWQEHVRKSLDGLNEIATAPTRIQ